MKFCVRTRFLLLTALFSASVVHAQSAVFTYQGRLNNGSNLANGVFDLQFALYNAPAGGTEIGSPITETAQAISNGLFTANLDFGSGIFTGASNWLQIAARTNGASSFTNLVPRQWITPTPYAIFAESANAANLSGAVSDANLPSNVALRTGGNSFSGNQSLAGAATYEFGQGFAKETDAGKIGYQAFSGGLDIVGAGLTAASRQITLWAEGGATVTGPMLLGGIMLSNENFGPGNQQLWVTETGRSQASATNLAVRISPFNSGGVGSIDALSTDGSQFKNLILDPNGGNVGVGTFNPLTSFQLGDYGKGNQFFSIKSAGGYLYQTGIQFRHYNNTDGFDITDSELSTNDGLNVVRYPYNGTPATVMYIDRYSGNLGLGTFSPQTTLQIGDFSTGDQFLSLVSAGSNLHRTGIQFRHFNETDGFDITDSEFTTNNGLNIIRYPYTGSSTPAPVTSMFIGRYSGNVGIGTVNPATALDIAGEITCTIINITSDRNAKEAFQPVNAQAVLDKLARLPITEWQYKTQSGERHIGPMAQDFHDAFAVGRDDKHITSVDADGVALAAIQGLNEKVDAMRNALNSRERENAELKAQLDELKQIVRQLQHQGDDEKSE